MGRKRRRGDAKETQDAAAAPTKQESPVNGTSMTPGNGKKQTKTLQLKIIGVKKPIETKKVEAPKEAAKHHTPEADGAAMKKKKKSKKKKSSNDDDEAISPTEKQSSKTKVDTTDIDDLFQSLKGKKQAQIEAEEKQKQEEEMARKREKKERLRMEEQIKKLEAQNTNSTAVQGKNPEARPVRYDEDGLPIYTEESLQINKGGDTAECPFDCWCCF
ncbi:hypothetical protein Poli38472_002002 [Pythium oligandrum]|uniref:Uncharacterized protein n=1 Tax=Pythium oligandrum TaxID=41045 RepID=A0A8K1CU05_PYTOL|nr:hypothetical protein Poli38472_002002 [Pythium oligandrum]|eukprot:TMW69846.1 hypothetical protein Poli38472_002002 [Pythium oligandrum]